MTSRRSLQSCGCSAIEKSIPRRNDMNSFSRKFVGFVVFNVLFIWLLSVRNKDISLSQYESVKLKAEQTHVELIETKNELENLKDNFRKKCSVWDPELSVVYAITPTYARTVQEAELTRLSHTFRLVPNFHWIMVEDAKTRSALVANLLKASMLNYTHLTAETPFLWKPTLVEFRTQKPRGVAQRNTAIKWLRENRNKDTDKGIVYFADDDNTYSLKVFKEMRTISKVGVWPVGLVAGMMAEKPLIDRATGRVAGWNSLWEPERDFPIDMAGFAVNLQHFLMHPEAKFTFSVKKGYQESALLSKLVTIDDLEPKADNCTKVYVWHTKTVEPYPVIGEVIENKSQLSDENIEIWHQLVTDN